MGATAAQATTVSDPKGDILSTFTATTDAVPDLDVVSASATFNAKSLMLSATMAGNIGLSDEGKYVWGINRGQGTALLDNPTHLSITDPPIGAGVLFDSFIVLGNTSDAGGTGVLLKPSGNPKDPQDFDSAFSIDPSWVNISGKTITLTIDRSLFPSTGFDFKDFGFNIWPRYGDTTNNNMVTDFAPDGDPKNPNNTFKATAVPEPAGWALMITGFGLAGTALRRRRRLLAA